MYEKCSLALASHASAVFATMTRRRPDRVETRPERPGGQRTRFTLGERVDFRGENPEGARVNGFFICAFDTLEKAVLFARDVADYLGLPSSTSKAETDNYVGEFLNVVIGLTCSAWADHGLRVDFSPPERLQEHDVGDVPESGHCFRVSIESEGHYSATILLFFLPEAAAPLG